MEMLGFVILACLCCVFMVTGQPLIKLQPIVGNLPEATFLQTAIVDITCEDPLDTLNGRVAINVVDITSSPTTGHCPICFQAYNLNVAVPNEWKLYFIPGSLDYLTASRYDIRITCRDSKNLISAPAIVGVNVIPNAPPFFNPIYVTISVTNSATRTTGYSIFTATAIDVNSDTLTYSMSTNIPTDIFQINAATGVITLNKPLGGLCRNNLLVYVEAVDNINPERARLTLNINFLQMNFPAVITNMNRVVSIQENAAPSSIPVNRFDLYQPDFSCSLTVQIPAMVSKFAFNPISYSIEMASFNYEVDSNTNVTVQCTDGLCPSTIKWLYFQILDANDNPKLHPPSQSLTVPEGYIDVLPNLRVTDEDVIDPHVFYIVSIAPNVAGFTIDKNTGRLRTTTDFRADVNDQRILDFLIAANDTKGMQPTNTVAVRLTVYDINDHRPILTRTSFEYTLDECTPLGVLDTLAATDQDGGINADIAFEGRVSGSITVASDGTITLTKAPVAGMFETMEVYAVDKGFNPKVLKSPAPAIITLIGIPCPTSSTIPVTTPGVSVPDSTTIVPTEPTLAPNQRKNNVKDLVWISAAAVLGLVVAGLMIFILYRCHKAARSRHRNMTASMADLTPRKNAKHVNPDKIRRRSSVIEENQPGNNKHSQRDYFKNDARDIYKDNYKTKTFPSAVGDV